MESADAFGGHWGIFLLIFFGGCVLRGLLALYQFLRVRYNLPGGDPMGYLMAVSYLAMVVSLFLLIIVLAVKIL